MKCGLCGAEFEEKDAKSACAKCPWHGCGLLRCPKCGYEMPPEPKWLKWFRREKKDDQ